MKRIAIASEANNINANLAYQAGRCPWFCILHPDGNISFVENPGSAAPAAFGLHAFRFLESQNTNAIVARFFGPRFQKLSRETSINLIVPPPHMHKIKDIIESFNNS
ncbi:MAG: hypothetical protein PF590_02945 [Candidatus Delongbacteria bacterium]|jgi:predicted Fe-Mo cluster-binding NifX family protein|nr:hypothetical protein [Candidatus Delongbacteria bacterium]